jgi:crotonobetainyl-CoA:carnitine CoA-transferase CaiB-like acyl-CoA transferase
MADPLTGIKVVELARILAGPWAGQVLADLGAEVVKVESPEGDDTRRWGRRSSTTRRHARRGLFPRHQPRQALGVADFAHRGRQALVLELVRDADVLIENFKLGGLATTASTTTASPRSTRASSTARSPASGRTALCRPPGYDFIIQGMSGIMDLSGEPTARRPRSASPMPTS